MNSKYTIKDLLTGVIRTFEIVKSYWDGKYNYVPNAVWLDDDFTEEGIPVYEKNIISNANPKKGTISDRSPVGMELLKSSIGDIITYNKHKYLVLSIEQK